jgi:hypothetical protein
MNQFLKYTFIGVLFASCGQKPAPEKHELASILFKQQQAWNTGNLEEFMEGYSRDSNMQFITSKGVRKGWQKTLDAYKKNYNSKEKMGYLEFNLSNIEFLDMEGNVGHINGTWKLIRKADTPSGHFSLITKREKFGHKIFIDHTW